MRLHDYRKLTEEEKVSLKKNGCISDSWDKVMVLDPFYPQLINNVRFSGDVFIGRFENVHHLEGDAYLHSGLFNTALFNVSVGDNVLIENVGFISNYNIEDGARISRVAKLFTEADSFFGNGVEVKVLSEAGGRETIMYEGLSSHIAYMMSLYRYDVRFISALKSMIIKEVERHRALNGVIGKCAVIEDVKTIRNVKIGDYAKISGAVSLENGTVVSRRNAVSIVGNGVICRDFIIQSDSKVMDSAILESSFVGQGCVLSKGFSASNSLFFANSHFENGESAALFAGPYTVSHHKSTLLIGTMFSFMNAGSATNFSNHLYKSGPVHQGIFERGVKFASGSYMMLPVKTGAFSTVVGHHAAHIDTSDFPFSYIVESKGKTKLIPGIALNSSGLFRDWQKWPARDKRSRVNRIDNIVFDIISPVVWGSMKRGFEILKELFENLPPDGEAMEYKGFFIDAKSIERGMELYANALSEYPVRELCRLWMKYGFDYVRKIDSEKDERFEKWVDISGMPVPAPMIRDVMEEVKNNDLNDINGLNSRLRSLFDSYDDYICKWLSIALPEELISSRFAKETMTKHLLLWKESVVSRLTKIYQDAGKEFSLSMSVSFGMDGEEGDIEKDLSEVRGTIDGNPLCLSIKNLIEKVEKFTDGFILTL